MSGRGIEELLGANREYQRLRRAGKPIPGDVRRKRRAYQRERRRLRDPGGRRKPAYGGIPGEWRAAANEYQRLRRAGKPVPKGVVLLRRAYERACYAERRRSPRWRAGAAGRYWPPARSDIPEELRQAAWAYRRLVRWGEPVPEDIMEKARAYWRACYGRQSGLLSKRPRQERKVS